MSLSPEEVGMLVFLMFGFIIGVMVGRFWRARVMPYLPDDVRSVRCRSCGWQSFISNHEDGLCSFCRRAEQRRNDQHAA
jgi:hypothetical protein